MPDLTEIFKTNFIGSVSESQCLSTVGVWKHAGHSEYNWLNDQLDALHASPRNEFADSRPKRVRVWNQIVSLAQTTEGLVNHAEDGQPVLDALGNIDSMHLKLTWFLWAVRLESLWIIVEPSLERPSRSHSPSQVDKYQSTSCLCLREAHMLAVVLG